MFDLNNVIGIHPYSLEHKEKNDLYLDALSDLTELHYKKCPEYKKILDMFNFNVEGIKNIENIPFIPVRLFKEYELLSVDKDEITKTMTSSGTTGQRVSSIYLDKVTSTNQTKVLTKIVSSFTGVKRLPMLVIDSDKVIKDRHLFSARGAGILGFSMHGYDITYALDEQMKIDINKVKTFLDKHSEEKILVFGFTSMIWEYLYCALKETNIKLQLNNGILIHGGGWKKLKEKAVDNEEFKKSIFEVTGITEIHNYYGMVEQTGSIFMECEEGHLHASIFSDVLIRDYRNFSILKNGQKGLIQLLSLLPESYPGHSILSEDIGEIIGEDDCPCGRKGKYFKIYGRIKDAEIRGCSDTYA